MLVAESQAKRLQLRRSDTMCRSSGERNGVETHTTNISLLPELKPRRLFLNLAPGAACPLFSAAVDSLVYSVSATPMSEQIIETEETLIIETPERVPLAFALASIGNRFLARPATKALARPSIDKRG